MFEAFNKVTQVTGLGPNNPARLNLMTGELQINMDLWPWMTPEQREDVIAHEEGHWVLRTKDENKADEYALLKQASQGRSLKGAVVAMTTMLKNGNPSHEARAWRRFELAKKLDGQLEKSKAMCKGSTPGTRCRCGGNTASYTGQIGDSIYEDAPINWPVNDPYVNYGVLGICLSKKCRAAKAEAKSAKQSANNTAKVLLASQGIKTGLGGVFQDIGNGLAGVVNTAQAVTPAAAALAGGGGVGALLGGEGANLATQTLQAQTQNAVTQQLAGIAPQNDPAYMMQVMQMQAEQQAAAKKKQQTTIIIIAVVVVILVVLAVLLTRKKAVA